MNEKEIIRESMSHEQSKSAELIRLESDVKALTEARSEDKKYIEMLEKELRNCSQEIGYLQDELNLRNVEANCVGEHVHSLELKLSEVRELREKVTELMEELHKSGSQCLFLKRALEHKEMELQNSTSHIEKLENAISSIALESQCEIESVKLDSMDLEQRYLEAKKLDEQAIQEKANMESLIEELEVRLEETEQMVSNLENDNRELHEKLRKSEENVKMFYETVEEHLDKWFRSNNKSVFCTPGVSNQPFHTKLENRLPTLEQLCSREVLEPFLSKLAAVKTCDDDLKEEMEKMSNHICESELLVKQLKEELREEKAKAKEEAEDLTQEMAELRYQITDMLEQECKRRSCIEQASLQRIAELEAQVREEQRKYFIAIRRYHEAQKLAESRSAELHHLKNALALQELCPSGRPPIVSQKTGVCSCGDCKISNPLRGCFDEVLIDAEISDEARADAQVHQPAIEWYSEEIDDT
ncbi:hypothetical protein AAC387_Pa03g3252 [Persea americana]